MQYLITISVCVLLVFIPDRSSCWKLSFAPVSTESPASLPDTNQPLESHPDSNQLSASLLDSNQSDVPLPISTQSAAPLPSSSQSAPLLPDSTQLTSTIPGSTDESASFPDFTERSLPLSDSTPRISRLFYTSTLRNALLDGAPELDIPSLSSLHIHNVPLNGTTFTIVLSDVTFNDSTDLQNIAVSEESSLNDTVSIGLSFPHLRVTSLAFGDGEFEDFTFSGFGDVVADFYDVAVNFNVENPPQVIDLPDLSFSKFDLSIANLYKDDPTRNDALNEAVAKNIDQLREPHTVLLVNSIGKVLADSVRKYVSHLPQE